MSHQPLFAQHDFCECCSRDALTLATPTTQALTPLSSRMNRIVRMLCLDWWLLLVHFVVSSLFGLAWIQGSFIRFLIVRSTADTASHTTTNICSHTHTRSCPNVHYPSTSPLPLSSSVSPHVLLLCHILPYSLIFSPPHRYLLLVMSSGGRTTTVFDIGSFKSKNFSGKDERLALVFMARTAETAERYEDMCRIMRELVLYIPASSELHRRGAQPAVCRLQERDRLSSRCMAHTERWSGRGQVRRPGGCIPQAGGD